MINECHIGTSFKTKKWRELFRIETAFLVNNHREKLNPIGQDRGKMVLVLRIHHPISRGQRVYRVQRSQSDTGAIDYQREDEDKIQRNVYSDREATAIPGKKRRRSEAGRKRPPPLSPSLIAPAHQSFGVAARDWTWRAKSTSSNFTAAQNCVHDRVVRAVLQSIGNSRAWCGVSLAHTHPDTHNYDAAFVWSERRQADTRGEKREEYKGWVSRIVLHVTISCRGRPLQLRGPRNRKKRQGKEKRKRGRKGRAAA